MRTSLVVGVFAAPVMFLFNLMVAYLVATSTCQAPQVVMINGITVACLGAIVMTGMVSWSRFKTLRARGDQDQLLAMVGAAGAALFAIVNLMLLLATHLVPPCG